MTWDEARSEMATGCLVTRAAWASDVSVEQVRDRIPLSYVMTDEEDGRPFTIAWKPSGHDVAASDWRIWQEG